MKSWQEEQFQALDAAACETQLFEAITTIASKLGFDYCAYGFRMPIPLTRPKFATFSNYPAAWQARYQEKNYLESDPTVQHGMRSLLPVVWSDALFVPARELWDDARSAGLEVGWAQSCRNVCGAGGMLTLARSHEPLSEAELRDKGLEMTWLAQVAHSEMSRLLMAKATPASEVNLSAREAEVLRWTGDGKTSGEISDILNISERTVNFHLGNAVSKLNACNKASAVVMALKLGLLD